MVEFIKRNSIVILSLGVGVSLFAVGALLLSTPAPPPLEMSAQQAAEDSRTYGAGDLAFWIQRGKVPGIVAEHKFGRNTNVDNGVATDVWDLSIQPIWVAPTQARTHAITSTSTSDDGSPVGVGARTLKVYGLVDWDTKETTETITLNGTFAVTTTNSFVCVHRLEVLTKGATDVNVGTIAARATTDSTITAQINPGAGQTEMAIYCIPSVQTAYMGFMMPTLSDVVGTGEALIEILYNPEPDVELLNFVSKSMFSLRAGGQSGIPILFWVPRKFAGPGILKIQATGTQNDLVVSAMFDLILIDN